MIRLPKSGCAVLACLALTGAASAGPALTFDTEGGDAWEFDKRIEGAVAQGDCDAVFVSSPAGNFKALLEHGHFLATVHLRSGVNDVAARCWRGGAEVARSARQHWVVRVGDGPRAWIRTRVDGAHVWMDAGRTELARGISAPIVRYEWVASHDNPAPLGLLTGRQVEIGVPAVDGMYRLTLRVSDALGRSDESMTILRVAAGRAATVEAGGAGERPEWLEGAVIYGVALPWFTPPGFAGVTRRLDEIAALGASAIWLSPITEAPPGDFGYAVTDPFRLRSTFGTEAQFKALVAAAHSRGLRVLLDLVSSHLSDRHPYYLDTVHLGHRSAYYNWFERDASGRVAHYFDWTHLENLNYDNPEVRAYSTASFARWVRDYHIDGFRLDASWAVRERAPEFWPRLGRELRRIDPEVVLLAEATARDAYYPRHGFDAAYDWTSKLGEWAWQSAFAAAAPVPDLRRLRAALTNDGNGFPDRVLVLHFLNNNDTGARFITLHGIAADRAAAVLLLTIPGLPLVYDGDEVGAALNPYRGGPPITWQDPYRLTALYTQLAHLRRATAALRSGDLRLMRADHADTVLVFARQFGHGTPAVVVAINFSAAPVEARLRPAESLPCVPKGAANTRCEVEDLLSGRRLSLERDSAIIPLKSYEAVVLQLGDSPAAAHTEHRRPVQ